jgi:hypothetical protein
MEEIEKFLLLRIETEKKHKKECENESENERVFNSGYLLALEHILYFYIKYCKEKQK